MTILRIENGDIRVFPEGNETTLSIEEWRNNENHNANVIVVVPNDIDVTTLGDLSGVDKIALEFPAFNDGRAFTQARILRERLGFGGEIRATGDVLCDQALFMARAGIDALDIGDGDVEGFKNAIGAFSVFYQRAADAAPSGWALRRQRATVAA